jgi:hypothetical protein
VRAVIAKKGDSVGALQGNQQSFYEDVKKQLAAMKKIELTGFTNTEAATAYFKEKEAILESIVKTLETVTVQERAEVEALKSTVKAMREELKGQAANPHELSRRELLYNLGKGIAAAWAGNHKALADLSFSPNLKAAENWTNPRDVSWGERGWNVKEKTALGTPMGNMTTNDQYLINPIYETEIMTDAAKKSVMMNLVRHRPMMEPLSFSPPETGAALNYTGSPPTVSRLPGASRKGRNGWN